MTGGIVIVGIWRWQTHANYGNLQHKLTDTLKDKLLLSSITFHCYPLQIKLQRKFKV